MFMRYFTDLIYNSFWLYDLPPDGVYTCVYTTYIFWLCAVLPFWPYFPRYTLTCGLSWVQVDGLHALHMQSVEFSHTGTSEVPFLPVKFITTENCCICFIHDLKLVPTNTFCPWAHLLRIFSSVVIMQNGASKAEAF